MIHRCCECGSDNCCCPAPEKPKKKKTTKRYWSVAYHVDATGYIIVEADSEEEARELADDKFFPGSDNTEIGDAIEIVDVTELTEEEVKKSRRGVE